MNLASRSAWIRAAVQQKIRAGIDRLNNFQHEDGGWGWWETDESHPFMTAYVVAGLAQAKAAGVQVDVERIEKGAQWIGKAFAADAKLASDLRAYMQYALVVAGKPDAPRWPKSSSSARSCHRTGSQSWASRWNW